MISSFIGSFFIAYQHRGAQQYLSSLPEYEVSQRFGFEDEFNIHRAAF